MGLYRLLDVSDLYPLVEWYILIRRSDSVAQRTLTVGMGVQGTVPKCLDSCFNAGLPFGGVEFGGWAHVRCTIYVITNPVPQRMLYVT